MNIVDLKERELAASDLDHNLVILAGAGTGKTSLLIERLLHHLLERGTPINRLAAITFTDKAATELRERLEEALECVVQILLYPEEEPSRGEEGRRVLQRLSALENSLLLERARQALVQLEEATLSTIHGFCSELLRRHPREAGVDPEFSVDANGEEAKGTFDELWEAYLEENFGGEGEIACVDEWKSCLNKFSMGDIEELLADLCSFGFSVDAMSPKGLEAQTELFNQFCLQSIGKIKGLREDLSEVSKLNKNLLPRLDVWEECYLTILNTQSLPSDRAILQKNAPSLGKNADLTDSERLRIEKQLKAITDQLKKLETLDFKLASELSTIFFEFVSKFRAEFLSRAWVSHDSLIVLTRNILRDYPEIRKAESQRLDHLLIDEFQDTDPLQYEIAFYLSEAVEEGATSSLNDAYELKLRPGKIFIVGDPKQSIYRFRGADISACTEAIQAIQDKGGKLLTLKTNFRSVPNLVNPLNHLFKSYFKPEEGVDPSFDQLSPAKEQPSKFDQPIEIWSIGGSNKAEVRKDFEAEVLAERLAKDISEGRLRPGEVAILFRRMTSVAPYLRALQAQGVPYLSEGGRGFYERHEVSLLLILLRVIVSPADAASIVAWLRSGAGGTSDDELQRFAQSELHNDREGLRTTWNLELKPDEQKYPHLALALSGLRSFRDQTLGQPLDVIGEKACTGPLFLTLASSYDGAQRVANLEKILRRIAELTSDGQLTAEEVLDRIENQDTRLRNSGDSPLADASIDAVRILTIHKSKGLEWPVVILPDLVRENNPQVSVGPKSLPVGKRGKYGEALVLRYKGFQTPSVFPYLESELDQEMAEAKRLLYVAATRAKEKLIFIAGLGKKREQVWIDGLSAWGYELTSSHMEEGPLAVSDVYHRSFMTRSKTKPKKKKAGLLQEVLQPLIRWQESVKKNEVYKSKEKISPSSLSQLPASLRSEDSSESSLEFNQVKSMSGNEGKLVGQALHLLLEVWEGADPHWLIENASRATSVVVKDDSRVESIQQQLVLLIRSAMADPDSFINRPRERQRMTEVPVLYLDEDRRLVEGLIDSVEINENKDSLTIDIVDYKAYPQENTESLSEAMSPQLDAYLEGLRKGIGGKVLINKRLEHFKYKG